MSEPAPFNRRHFIAGSASLAAGSALGTGAAAAAVNAAAGQREDVSFRSDWERRFDRVWLGEQYWANPLQDWRLSGGRIECINAAAERNVHLLTRRLGQHAGTLRISVRVGRTGGGALSRGRGSCGFRVGIQGPLGDYRNSLVFGKGVDAGLTAGGNLFVGTPQSARAVAVDLDRESVELRLLASPAQRGYDLTLAAYELDSGTLLGKVQGTAAAEQLLGNIALVANFAAGQVTAARGKKKSSKKANVANAGSGTFWFSDWVVTGSKLETHEDRAFGPILFSQYTLSDGVLKMSAQMPPIGPRDAQVVHLEITRGGDWTRLAEAPIHPESRTATFRVAPWDDRSDMPYRLVYTSRETDGAANDSYWTGTVRRDPVDQPVITVADVSCNFHAAFPNSRYAANMAKLNPDLLAFVGDQFYESSGGYGIVRDPLDQAILDYLRKWYMHGWTWRDLTRDRPSVSLPDDHDVYQGNIWGEGGAARQATQEQGGYAMHPAWVNVVHQTQTSHHPDPFDPGPAKQNIRVYFGPLKYGRISFAVIADRMFKTGPEGEVPPTGGRGDHVTDPDFDPRTADLPGLELLGERQMSFLRAWSADWRGAEMKAVISQTIFTAMATTHGGNRQRLRADYDTNGWPQTPRNQALREIRKAFAFHMAGDQHLPAVVHYGIDEHDDAAVAFAGPAVNVGYPRWWEPDEPGRNRAPDAPENTGEFIDHFGHPLTVLAVANGAVRPRQGVLEAMHDKASGLGLVRFDKPNRRIIVECWPFLADPTAGTETQFPGWPVTVSMFENYGRRAVAQLPELQITGSDNPVIQVLDEADGEIVFTLRIVGQKFQPQVFSEGKYTVRISDPETGRQQEIPGITARAENPTTLKVTL